jgi:RNA polymerase sigma-70 factor (ECF subfamily)
MCAPDVIAAKRLSAPPHGPSEAARPEHHPAEPERGSHAAQLAARGESERALARLYQAHAGELHGFARRRVGRQDAEDVVQEAYLHLLQTGLSATLEQPRAYLFRIAANLAVDAARKHETRSRYADDAALFLGYAAGNGCVESEAEHKLEVRHFVSALTELPPLCRQAFLLNQIEGVTRSEIAKRLGLSVRTIDRHVVRALAHVRRRLEGKGAATPRKAAA